MASSTSTSAASAPTSFQDVLNKGNSSAQKNQGITIGSFLASLGVALIAFAVQFVVFLAIKNKLERIYLPRTFLVPERERTSPPPRGLWQWVLSVFRTSNSEFIQKCGLDAYFFLRYLRTLLRIFVPCMLVLLPILFPVNAVRGRGPNFTDEPRYNTESWTNVNGLDQLAWGNVRPDRNRRYWAHLILAIGVIVYTCWVFFDELKGYIRLRQAYLTSPQHRLRASATTVLITAIPTKWCTHEALDGLYDVFPGGIRNIWINRNFDGLSEKVKERDQLARTLESAETNLIKKCMEVAKKKAEKEAKVKGKKKSKAQLSEESEAADQAGLSMAQTDGVSAGNPHQMGRTLVEILDESSTEESARGHSSQRKKPLVPINVLGQGIEAVGHGIDNLGKAVFTRNASKKEKAAHVGELSGKRGEKENKKEEKPRTFYGSAYDEHYDPNAGEPRWSEIIKESDRETSRLPIFGWKWMISLPLLGQKVDTINYCRKEVARLNIEIEEDQRHPEKFPIMNSAFVQFNHQVAAHMACQAVSHHLPKQMAPRVVEINPRDVIWDNLSVKWWESYIRTGLVLLTIAGLVIGWAIPVTGTGLISRFSTLSSLDHFHWISKIPQEVASLIQGILPPVLLALLLVLLPLILRFLARQQGCLSGMSVELTVQKYYFSFLFVQLFLVVSISSGVSQIIPQLTRDPQSVPSLLATNLPKASNYFFSYMLLQAFSVSSGALLQVGELAKWYLLAPIMDSTARQKWRRQIDLPDVQWGKFFPVYTNLSCIGLIYSVVSPLILVFNIIAFGLFWFVYRYNTLFVTKFRFDTGGLLFPTAINQLFTGLYVMELCLIGLFFLVRDDQDDDRNPKTAKAGGTPCKAQAIIMIVVLIFTVIYQYLLNSAFRPLFRYLPITLEDEAVMRDEEFARAQEKRWALEVEQEHEGESETLHSSDQARPSNIRYHSDSGGRSRRTEESIEMQALEGGGPDLVGDLKKLLPPNPLNHPKGSWADRSKSPRRSTLASPLDVTHVIRSPRRKHHPPGTPNEEKDLESQQRFNANRIGEALFSGINDEIEDLTPDDRDKLVRRAFQHAALRARRPVIWVPRDNLGVSDDEIKRTKEFSGYIWISNEGTGLDSKGRVIYRRSPPDFSEIDLIEL